MLLEIAKYQSYRSSVLEASFCQATSRKWLSSVNLSFNIFHFQIYFTWCNLHVLIELLIEKELVLTEMKDAFLKIQSVCLIAISCSSVKQKYQQNRKNSKWITFHSGFSSYNFCNVSSILVGIFSSLKSTKVSGSLDLWWSGSCCSVQTALNVSKFHFSLDILLYFNSTGWMFNW